MELKQGGKPTPLKCTAATAKPIAKAALPLTSFLLPSHTPWMTKRRTKVNINSKHIPWTAGILDSTWVKPKLPLIKSAGSKAWNRKKRSSQNNLLHQRPNKRRMMSQAKNKHDNQLHAFSVYLVILLQAMFVLTLQGQNRTNVTMT